MPLTGLAQPWMFPNGAADKLAVNGQVFKRNHYGTWVSYMASVRAKPLSSYQFSSLGEWFVNRWQVTTCGRLNERYNHWYGLCRVN